MSGSPSHKNADELMSAWYARCAEMAEQFRRKALEATAEWRPVYDGVMAARGQMTATQLAAEADAGKTPAFTAAIEVFEAAGEILGAVEQAALDLWLSYERAARLRDFVGRRGDETDSAELRVFVRELLIVCKRQEAALERAALIVRDVPGEGVTVVRVAESLRRRAEEVSRG